MIHSKFKKNIQNKSVSGIFNFREIVGFILYWLYLPVFKLKKQQCLSIYMHDPSVALFEKLVKWLILHNYRIISLDDLKGYLRSRAWPKGKLVFLSLDDGWRNNMKLLPVIEKYHIPITIFVTTEPIESGNYWWDYVLKESRPDFIPQLKKMPQSLFNEHIDFLKQKYKLTRTSITENELIELIHKPLVNIQGHTATHPILTNCAEKEQISELVSSKEYLEVHTGTRIYAFSYPNGNYNDEVIKNVQNAGYELAFTTEQRHISEADGHNLFTLPRIAIHTGGGYYENLAKVLTIWQKMKV